VKAAVINASPLIILARAGLLGLLPKIFSSVVVPRAVWGEVRAGPVEPCFVALLDGAEWLSVVEMTGLSPLAEARLGRGETEVLEYARLHPGVIAVVDDKAARRLADGIRIPLTGTLGVLAAATRAGHIPDFAAATAQVIGAGLYIDKNTVARISEQLRSRGADRRRDCDL
jgi:predicted nucleic acid-binding protein